MSLNTCYLFIAGKDPVLQWGCFMLLTGAVFWAAMLRILSKGFIGPADTEHPSGKPFSVFALQFPFSFARFREFLQGLSPKTKKPVIWSMRADFIFMAFAYPFLSCWAWFLFRHSEPAGLLEGWTDRLQPALKLAIWAPGIAWVLDITENLLLLSCLRKLTAFKSKVMLAAASLKWTIVLAEVLLLLVTAVNNLLY